MSKFSYKSLLIIFSLLLIGVVILWKFILPKQKVSAAWWNDSWHYRQAIDISNTSESNLTDFQVSISIGTSALIASGKMQSDCDDIRVTDINGSLLPYWIEENNPGCNQLTDTKVWIKTSSLPTSGATVYLYYGNTTATNNENGDNVFEFFDDFNDSSLDTNKWTTVVKGVGGSSAVSNGNAVLSPTPNTISSVSLFSKSTFTSDIAIELRRKQGGNSYYMDFSLGNGSITDENNHTTNWWHTTLNQGYWWYFQSTATSSNAIYLMNNAAKSAINTNAYTLDTSNYVNQKMTLNSSGNLTQSNNGTSVLSGTNSIFIGSAKNILISQGEYSNGWGDTQYIDYIFVHKITSSDLTTSTQSEETGGGPIAYWKFDEGIGTTAYDSTGNHNGTLNSGSSMPTWRTEESCISGKCLLTQGNASSYIDTNYDFDLDYNSSSSISFWFKSTTIDTGNKVKNIIAKNNYQFIIAQENQLIRFIQWQSTGSNALSFNTSNFIQANTWYHLEFIYDNSQHKGFIYINGKLNGSANTISNNFINNTETLKIGTGYQYGGSTSPHFNGYIDDIKIYNYARTPDQIKQDYNSRGSLSGSSANLGVQSSTAPDLNSSLFSHWKFNNSLYNSVSTGSTAIAPLSGTPNYTSTGKDKQGLDFTQLYTGNFTYVSSNTFEDTTKNWTTNELVGYQFAADYAPNSQYCQGTITSNTSTTITFSGSCSSWSGNKYYRIKKSIYISAPLTGHSTNAITASLWFKSNTSQGNRIARMSNEAFHFTINGNNISTGINTYGGHITYTTTNANDQKWHYMAITYDGSTEKLYYDGIAVGLYSTATTVISNGSLTLGSRNDGMQEFFNGSIDEVKVYNRALTADEIKQDYNQGSAISFGSTNQTIGGTTTSLDYCIPGDTSYCAPPVAEWKMDEGVGTSIIDTSGNSNTGTFATGSSAPTWVQGKIGKATNFDGTNDYISVTNSTLLKQTSNYTLETWFKPKNNTAAFFILKNGEYGFKWNGSTSALQYYDQGYFSSSKTSWNLNQWYHLTMVKIGSTANLYINGILDSTNNSSATHNTAYNLEFGRFDSTYFNGSIDQIKIYNYARTPAQVAYDYNRGGPVGWWKMDECQGSTIYDWSGNGNNGTLTIGSNGTQNSIGTCQIGTSAAWTNGATGKFNSSLNFDGTDDYNSIPNNNSLNLTETGGAVSVWFKTNVNATGSVNGSLVAKTNTYTNGYWFTKYNNKLRISLYGTSNLEMVGNKIITDNLWHHAVATWTPNILSIYIDGVLDKSQGYSFTFSTASQPLYIARMLNTGEGYFSGQIDDVRVYNYALTPDQIKQIYNGGAISFN